MVHASRVAHGGLAIGVGAFGSAVWAQREPHCHRWSVWHTRLPKAPAPCGDDRGFGIVGVRNRAAPIPKAAPARSHSNYRTATEIALGAPRMMASPFARLPDDREAENVVVIARRRAWFRPPAAKRRGGST